MNNTVTMASDANLYQSNASRIEAFFDTELFLQNILKPMIDSSVVHHQIKGVVVFDNGAVENTDVFGLLFKDEALGFVTLLATNSGRQTNEIMGIFPIADGVVQRVHIDEVLVWNNQICATIRCSVNGYQFAFFATDYYFNREKYLDNEYLDINLARLPVLQRRPKGVFPSKVRWRLIG